MYVDCLYTYCMQHMWQTSIGRPKLQVSFRKRAAKNRALMRKISHPAQDMRRPTRMLQHIIYIHSCVCCNIQSTHIHVYVATYNLHTFMCMLQHAIYIHSCVHECMLHLVRTGAYNEGDLHAYICAMTYIHSSSCAMTHSHSSTCAMTHPYMCAFMESHTPRLR